MARRVVASDPWTVRALFAAHILEGEPAPAKLGRIRLHLHQREAVLRVHHSLREFGGALLADAVGLGKTFAALAVASSFEHTLVIAPAALRDNWMEAAERAGMAVRFVSMESLARRAVTADCDLLIVDEAHHFRSSTTRRYAALARLAARLPILLLTATPIHNRADDLTNLLALFAGGGAAALQPADLASCVIRRQHSEVDVRLPRLVRQRRVEIAAEQEILRLLLSLPPPLPPRDGHSCPTLVSLSLAHAWTSSDAALTVALRRRLATGSAIRDALALGRMPSRGELRAWTTVDSTVQLAFPELLVAGDAADSAVALPVLDAHLSALRDVLTAVRRAPSRDDLRSEALRAIRRAHRGGTVLAFSFYVETVRTLYRDLEADGGVAVLSADGGRIATGRLSRHEVLRQFRAPRHARENISLLLTTDLLSEGVDLPQAGVVVHLDLPWTAARLEQRVGRARRLGGRCARVWTYAFTQPPEIERVLRRETLIRRKSALGARFVGELALEPDSAQRQASAPRSLELTRCLLRHWRDPAVNASPSRSIHVASIRATGNGFIALVANDAQALLLCDDSLTGQATSDPARVYARLRQATGDDAPIAVSHFLSARRSIERWRSDRAIADLLHHRGVSSPLLRLVLQRLDSAVRDAPIHRRSVEAGRVATVRAALARRLPIGLERRIATAYQRPQDDQALLAELEKLLDAPIVRRDGRTPIAPIAVLLLHSTPATAPESCPPRHG